ncbi:MAG: type II toxin-antitoxin system VapC family toxin [Thermoleophilaceae bacterium]
MGAVALDANVVIGLIDPHDAHHREAVAELKAIIARGDALEMSSSAYAEVMVEPLRAGRPELVDGFVDASRITIVAIDRGISRAAAALNARHRSLRLGDALVLAVARERGAELLTFDARLRRISQESP